MKLHIRHETRYDYETSVRSSIQRLHLTPSAFATQKLLSWNIEAPGIDKALIYRDGFGNQVHVITSQGAHDHVMVVAQGVVEVEDAAGLVRGLVCPAPDNVFLRQTTATEPSPALVELARSAAARQQKPLDLAHELMREIHGRIVYQIGVTHSHTTAAEALADGKGVCQDHAHAMLSALRFLGVPGRYVTGYLVTEGMLPATASHAWAEALIPQLGWVGFDAANCKCPTADYVRVATGLDAPGVVPVRGSRRGGESENMTVSVLVQPAEQ
ncbi:transglutaminase family protein [Nordella sp. HKS 07]|uniref:transglutaminase family protein n=1 Tax=Nordella sp. HKS 07 TaxID=2712222 RepID=UPI0013E0F78D|nr:transglutaminase family protein [Nordella sp. HKS 07]QIG50185.1 transglutaminase family protein [Nordella sp. HKS 07]